MSYLKASAGFIRVDAGDVTALDNLLACGKTVQSASVGDCTACKEFTAIATGVMVHSCCVHN